VSLSEPLSGALLGGLAASLATALGALPALALRSVSDRLEGVMLGFAAGAMLFVVSHEVIPETHRKGHQLPATLGVMGGFAVMMVLDNAFA
jgi:ZIP family zinc transporter